MISLEKSVVISLDGTDMELFPYLSYILQDLWEIGSSPEIILHIIKKHYSNSNHLKILDLGCGKGAVSIHLAKELKCNCYGLDAMTEFIEEARLKAKEFGVEDICKFKTDDIRKLAFEEKRYDIIILGSIGPILGDHYETLKKLSKFLSGQGKIILDDGYIDDSDDYNDYDDFSHPMVEKRSVILKQIHAAGMCLVDEYVMQPDEIKESNEEIYISIEKRCLELIDKYPEKGEIFKNYIRKQKIENNVLETKINCTTMIIKKLQNK